ncbi:peptidoglycan DD-metalloendopeptidase family protein [Cereibacter sphaeroides]|uniref:M23 family metallopeptidase n=1 Tax=Cereibacter sphaeroides TaxID=1063 RepID=UPI001F2D6A31|nr:M23 family metallopeptidase [Cereibacter sphaeroides]MCE6960342.1 peptidoglycan DD-metalloendopeptidase family protein [Cereibacter sphaeroides]MCE6969291.1 peptidoglycan DD-metalloendopeptidase family protein [Cereibacter sphaeroides]MCE6975350.1 peptidoglycan DD-metalloendopeptidase family protein [Cereibacter sphaeroides]
MFHRPPLARALCMTATLAILAACSSSELDWDLRSRPGALNTSDAARSAAPRPRPDARGIISYPNYQVAVAQQGDTVASLSSRVGLDPVQVARYNALTPQNPLRAGEIVVLPQRVAAAPAMAPAPVMAAPASVAPAQGIDVTTIATTALDRAGSAAPPPAAAPAPVAAAPAAAPAPARTADEPARHRVARGETAYSIARSYNVSAKALADWNGLGPDLAIREGQYLIIPTAAEPPPAPAPTRTAVTVPGVGSPTPTPPSAAKPLPDEKPAPAAAKPPGQPASPDLGAQRTAASASRLGFPVQGTIIRGYVQKKNDGIDIAASAGTPVAAAADGTVAAITQDTDQVPILVIRHPDNLLTVYANIDGIKVAKGASVKRGQTIATVRAADPAFVHFEVRKGFESVDPMPYLQ